MPPRGKVDMEKRKKVVKPKAVLPSLSSDDDHDEQLNMIHTVCS